MKELARAVEEGMNKKIQDIRDQVEAVLEEKKKGQAAVNARKEEIHKINQSMVEADKILIDFIFALAKS